MITRKINIKILALLFATIASLPAICFGSSIKVKKNDIKTQYLNGEFSNISKFFTLSDFKEDDKSGLFIYLESVIRSGKYEKSGKLLSLFKQKYKNHKEMYPLEAMYFLSVGELIKAREIAYSKNLGEYNSLSLLQVRFLLSMFERNFSDSEKLLKQMGYYDNVFKNSQLFFLLASELYKLKGEFDNLALLYKDRLKNVKKNSGNLYYSNLKLNYKLYRKKAIPFLVRSENERIEVPFEKRGKDSLRSIKYNVGGESYVILIDTGNTSGWIVHNRNLRESLKSKRGGRTITDVGTESEPLDGFNIYCKKLKFNDFEISGLFGNYVPKPRREFFDANLNPTIIKNRVTSIDFINDRMILRTKKRFYEDIEKAKNINVMKIPWYGYKYPMVPILCENRNGLGVVETGAGNISVQDFFVRQIGINLIEKSKYLSNGRIFKYFLCPVNIQLGKYLFVRNQAEAWPLKKFMNRLSGFSPHVIFGPESFEQKFIVSFVPEDNLIVFEYEKRG